MARFNRSHGLTGKRARYSLTIRAQNFPALARAIMRMQIPAVKVSKPPAETSVAQMEDQSRAASMFEEDYLALMEENPLHKEEIPIILGPIEASPRPEVVEATVSPVAHLQAEVAAFHASTDDSERAVSALHGILSETVNKVINSTTFNPMEILSRRRNGICVNDAVTEASMRIGEDVHRADDVLRASHRNTVSVISYVIDLLYRADDLMRIPASERNAAIVSISETGELLNHAKGLFEVQKIVDVMKNSANMSKMNRVVNALTSLTDPPFEVEEEIDALERVSRLFVALAAAESVHDDGKTPEQEMEDYLNECRSRRS